MSKENFVGEKNVKKILTVGGAELTYELAYKNVKNINLRIKSDGSISVSANKFVPPETIEDFIKSKESLILKVLNSIDVKNSRPLTKYFGEEEIKSVILSLCRKVYPLFEEKGVKYPIIKFRKMVSQWGNCHSQKGILTFNINLIYAPFECIEYVVFHEFTHFLQPNHSHLFYEELEKVCPNWQECRKRLKTINIR